MKSLIFLALFALSMSAVTCDGTEPQRAPSADTAAVTVAVDTAWGDTVRYDYR